MKNLTFKRKIKLGYCRKSLYDYLGVVKEVETDKDRALKTFRLSRHESPPIFAAADIIKLAVIASGAAIICTLIIAAYFSGYPWALGGAAIISLLGLFIAAISFA